MTTARWFTASAVLLAVCLGALALFAQHSSPTRASAVRHAVQPTQARSLATTYYVNSAHGSDSSSGTTEATAWKTLANVDSHVFAPGGTWTGQLHPLGSGLPGDPIVIGAYGSGARPRFVYSRSSIPNGEIGAAIFLLNQGYWTIHHVAAYAPAAASNFGTLAQPGQARYGIFVADNGGGTISGITISDNSVSGVGGCFNCSDVDSHLNGGIIVEAVRRNDSFHDVDISHNRVTDVARSGIVVWDQSYYTTSIVQVVASQLSTGVIIEHNSLSMIAGDGIIVFGTAGAVVDGNTVRDAAQRTIIGSTEAASVGIMTTRAIGSVIEHNRVSGTLTQFTDGEGYDVDLGSTDTVVEYNYSQDNEGGFLLFVGGFSSGLVVRDNTSVNDAYSGLKGVFSFDTSATSVSIYDNTVKIPRGSPARLIFCQNCAPAAYNVWSFFDNVIDGSGHGVSVLPPGTTMTTTPGGPIAYSAGDPGKA